MSCSHLQQLDEQLKCQGCDLGTNCKAIISQLVETIVENKESIYCAQTTPMINSRFVTTLRAWKYWWQEIPVFIPMQQSQMYCFSSCPVIANFIVDSDCILILEKLSARMNRLYRYNTPNLEHHLDVAKPLYDNTYLIPSPWNFSEVCRVPHMFWVLEVGQGRPTQWVWHAGDVQSTKWTCKQNNNIVSIGTTQKYTLHGHKSYSGHPDPGYTHWGHQIAALHFSWDHQSACWPSFLLQQNHLCELHRWIESWCKPMPIETNKNTTCPGGTVMQREMLWQELTKGNQTLLGKLHNMSAKKFVWILTISNLDHSRHWVLHFHQGGGCKKSVGWGGEFGEHLRLWICDSQRLDHLDGNQHFEDESQRPSHGVKYLLMHAMHTKHCMSSCAHQWWYQLLCCLSLGVCLAPISLSLPYPHPLVLFIPWITLCFHLFRIPWLLCDPSAPLLPCVPLPILIFLQSSPYSSCLIVSSCTINHLLPISLLTRLLMPLCLTFPLCIVDQYRPLVTLYKPQ